MGPGDLEKLVKNLPTLSDPRILAGSHYSDDAAVFQIDQNVTIIQTVDFFPPVVDDPYDYGAIAAANSMSDVYAMGGIPLTGLNIVGFPAKLDLAILSEILRGALDKSTEAGMFIVGGHTVKDSEIKFGIAVTGILTEKSFTPNSKARVGDKLVLTKPIGTGIITTGIKKDLVPDGVAKNAVDVMKQLNARASKMMIEMGAQAATDVTGFGLLGHANRMAESSGVSFVIYSDKVPVLKGAYDILQKGAYPGGSSTNRAYAEPHTFWEDNVEEPVRKILCDAQTSGGLLISIKPEKARDLVDALRTNDNPYPSIIGEVIEKKRKNILVK